MAEMVEAAETAEAVEAAETAETAEMSNFDEFKGKDCVFGADWLKTKGLHKLCSVFEGV